tara:strand:+ start:105 stop:905 length:801 start_codon:yes stop_codon:yes gene_type:complete
LPTTLKLTAHQSLEHRVRAIHEEGFVYFPNYLDKEEIRELRQAMEHLTPITESFDKELSIKQQGYYEKSINNAFNRNHLFLSYLDRAEIIDLAEAIHGPDCHSIGMTAWMTGPGRTDQELHADWQPLNLPEDIAADHRVKIPVLASTAHFYLDDVDWPLGPTMFIPGSHRAGRAPSGDTHFKGRSEEGIICRAGDVVIFRSEVWHRGSANHSDRTRYLLQVHYANRMITQKFPPYLNRFQFNPAILEMATPRQRRLLGDHVSANYD